MRKRACYALVAIIFALSFTGCDEFFSTSKGTSRDYDSSKIPTLSAENVDPWFQASVRNPKLAVAVLDKIMQELSGNLGEKDKAKLLDVGRQLAVISSGIGESILTNANALASLGDLTKVDPNTLTTIFGNIWSDFNSGGGNNAAGNLAALAGKSLTVDNSTPQFDPAFAGSAKPADVGEAVMVLVLGILSDSGKDASDWNSLLDSGLPMGLNGSGDGVTVSAGASDKEIALAAYLNLIVGDPQYHNNPITSNIRDAFFSNDSNDN